MLLQPACVAAGPAICIGPTPLPEVVTQLPLGDTLPLGAFNIPTGFEPAFQGAVAFHPTGAAFKPPAFIGLPKLLAGEPGAAGFGVPGKPAVALGFQPGRLGQLLLGKTPTVVVATPGGATAAGTPGATGIPVGFVGGVPMSADCCGMVRDGI